MDFPIPKPEQILFPLVVVLCIAMGILLLWQEPIGLLTLQIILLSSLGFSLLLIFKIPPKRLILYAFAFSFPIANLGIFRFEVNQASISPALVLVVGLLPFTWLQAQKKVPDVWRAKDHPLRHEIFWMTAFIIVAALSIFISIEPDVSVRELGQLLVFFLIYLILSNAFTDTNVLKNSLLLFMVGTLFILPISLEYIDFRLLTRLRLPGSHPNFIGMMLANGFIVSLGFIAITKGKWRFILILISISLLLGIVFSFSRGAWLATGLGSLVFLLLSRLKINYRNLSLFAFLALFIFSILLIPIIYTDPFQELVLANDLIQRNLARFSVSTAARIDILSTFVFRFLSNPILGIGFESSLHIDSIYFDLPKRAHNTFLAILTGTGLFGFFPFMMFFGIHFNNLLKARAKLFDDNLILANLLVAMFIMALISMLVQTSFVSTQFWVFLAWQGAMINTAFIQNSQPAKIHPVHS